VFCVWHLIAIAVGFCTTGTGGGGGGLFLLRSPFPSVYHNDDRVLWDLGEGWLIPEAG